MMTSLSSNFFPLYIAASNISQNIKHYIGPFLFVFSTSVDTSQVKYIKNKLKVLRLYCKFIFHLFNYVIKNIKLHIMKWQGN